MPKGLLALLGIYLLMAAYVHAKDADIPAPRSSITLAWDQSRNGNVKGYRVHYGVPSGRNYLHVVDAGKATSCRVSDLIPGKKYYFVVTAYNASGRESPPSHEITFTAPKATVTPNP
jgi:hypothetical protein